MTEARIVGEVVGLRRSRFWPTSGAPSGGGRPVVLVGGFAVPTTTVAPLVRWLRSGCWDVHVADLGWNVGCGESAVAELERLIRSLASQGGPVSLIGHSRGGVLARVAAVRADDVATLVTVCTPWTLGPPDRPGVRLITRAVRYARAHGYRGLGSVECATGDCCAEFRADMRKKPSASWTVLWSRADNVVGRDWQTSGQDATVEIGTTHLGAVLSESGWAAIAAALGAVTDDDRQREARRRDPGAGFG